MSTPPHAKSKTVNASAQYESITGVVERLTFHSEESGYTVACYGSKPGSTAKNTLL